jgi:hypothetical protein
MLQELVSVHPIRRECLVYFTVIPSRWPDQKPMRCVRAPTYDQPCSCQLQDTHDAGLTTCACGTSGISLFPPCACFPGYYRKL